MSKYNERSKEALDTLIGDIFGKSELEADAIIHSTTFEELLLLRQKVDELTELVMKSQIKLGEDKLI